MGFGSILKLVFLNVTLVASYGYANIIPQTSVTLNSDRGCSVHIGAWLSPSCTHCAEYFTSVLPKLASKPGFCIDYHSLPHMYLMDMPVSVLIWSQGPDNAIRNAKLFYRKQSDWLTPSVDKGNVSDPSRKDDIEEFLKEMLNKFSSETISRIRSYLSPTDPSLYVKIFALKNGFSIEHLQRFLPNGSADEAISRSLLQDLPRTMSANGDMAVVKYSPAFTFVKNGTLIPDEQLDGKILTEDSADAMLKKAGPPVLLPKINAREIKPSTNHRPTDIKKALAKRSVKIDIEEDDEDIQEADDDEIDPLAEDDSDEDEVTAMSERLQAVIEAQTKEMG